MDSRQYSLTVTVTGGLVSGVLLRHRRFPCRADHWDGAERWTPGEPLPVESFGDFLDVLYAASDADFVAFWGPRRP